MSIHPRKRPSTIGVLRALSPLGLSPGHDRVFSYLDRKGCAGRVTRMEHGPKLKPCILESQFRSAIQKNVTLFSTSESHSQMPHVATSPPPLSSHACNRYAEAYDMVKTRDGWIWSIISLITVSTYILGLPHVISYQRLFLAMLILDRLSPKGGEALICQHKQS